MTRCSTTPVQTPHGTSLDPDSSPASRKPVLSQWSPRPRRQSHHWLLSPHLWGQMEFPAFPSLRQFLDKCSLLLSLSDFTYFSFIQPNLHFQVTPLITDLQWIPWLTQQQIHTPQLCAQEPFAWHASQLLDSSCIKSLLIFKNIFVLLLFGNSFSHAFFSDLLFAT